MSASNDGGPAFPAGYHPEGNSADQHGMSLRDWFAGQVIGHFAENALHQRWKVKECALDAYVYADAMLRAREQKEAE